MNDISAIIHFVAEAVLHAWPFFLISIVFSVLIHTLKFDGLIRRTFDRRIGMAIILAVFVGAFSPFCACTIVPIIAGLLASGVPLAPIMAFWIASPTMDPEIFALSVGILGWPMAVARLSATLVLSLAAGFLTLALTHSGWLQTVLPIHKLVSSNKTSPAVTIEPAHIPVLTATMASPEIIVEPDHIPVLTTTRTAPTALAQCGTGSCSLPEVAPHITRTSRLTANLSQVNLSDMGRDIARESWKLGRWLLLAFVFEALIILYLPQERIAAALGADNWFAIPLAAVVGIPLYLTNISALPVVSGLLAQGMQPGAAIAFLIAGPVTTIPAMTAVWGIVHRRIFFLYLTIGLIGAIILGFVTNLLII
jgi:uncharacterized membrane protein YraQ (UPF0718 family)